jgi:drug/metabolite transporter (DMT)-like permease
VKTDDSFSRRSVMLMLASVVLFAVNTLLIRAISLRYPVADGWVATVFRGALGLLFVFGVYGWGRGLEARRLLKGRLITIRGVVGALSIVAFYVTIIQLGAAQAVILNLTYPIFASVIAAIWLKEKLSRAAMAWMVVDFCGLGIFLSDHQQSFSLSPYIILGLAGACGAGWVVVIIRRLRHEEHPATIYASQALYSLVIASPALSKLPNVPLSAWGWLALAAVVVTVAQLVMTQAYQSMSVARGSSLQMTLPLVTAVGGWMCFGESFHPQEIAGAILTLAATWRVLMSH